MKQLGAPHVTTSALTNEDVLDADHPLVEHRISVHKDPGAVPDRTLVFAEEWIRVEAVDGEPSGRIRAEVDDQQDRFDVTATPDEEPLPGLRVATPSCGSLEPCDAEHIVRFRAPQGLDGPTTVRWTVTSTYKDYSAAAAPADRTIDVRLLTTTTMADGADSVTHSISGQARVVSDHDKRFETHLIIRPNDALEGATPDPGSRLVMRQTLTVTAVEASGPQTRGKHLRLIIGSDEGAVIEFDADGLPHVVRHNALITCPGDDIGCRRKPDVYDPHLIIDIFTDPGIDQPITADWTLETTFVPFGGTRLPAGADFTIEVAPPRP